jgi:mono/diheme cytochrome c family protein
MKFRNIAFGFASVVFAAIALTSCQRSHDDRGWEFAPNMYHSRAYEPLTQIEKNNINPYGMNMRVPAEGSIPRRNFQTKFGSGDSAKVDLMIYNLPADSIEYAENNLTNPVPETEKSLAEGKELYEKFCLHCHGEGGAGDGSVGKVYKGVPNYSADAYKDMNDGHVFHVITHGKGRMWPHGSQMTPIERWKIVQYVHKLQKGEQ